MTVRVQVFPSSDRAFADYARACLKELGQAEATAEGPALLQQAIRRHYPAAFVSVQSELGRHGDGPVVWYAFRTAALGREAEARTTAELEPTPEDDEAPEWPAWAVVDDQRRFVQVSESLAAIAEVPVEAMIGQPIEAFSNPDDPTIGEDIERLWGAFMRDRLIASTMRFNYADGRPRELAYRLEADAAGPGRHWLSVRDVPR